ncbi:hypothetical protein TNCV_2240561 [Trichonephila clavipes]|nr:hypothetical protein TNCV_2240561 [Trichonephila clavipes]
MDPMRRYLGKNGKSTKRTSENLVPELFRSLRMLYERVNINVAPFNYTRASGEGPHNFEPWTTKLDLNLFFFEDSLSEESEVQNQNRDLNIQGSVRSVSQVNVLMDSIKQANDLADDLLESITSYISEHDGRTHVRETNDLIEKIETTWLRNSAN